MLKNLFILFLLIILASFKPYLSFTYSNTKNSAEEIRKLGCDTMAHVQFWQKIMHLDKDSCLINIHCKRIILAKLNNNNWIGKDSLYKSNLADSLKEVLQINDTNKVVGTTGKSFFYDFSKVAPLIPKGMKQFENYKVDGWYAKSILLIESPNQLQKSHVGAYGPFQLMPGIARMYGLRVNRKKDERANFNRSAYAAAMLIKNICIPKTEELLTELNIPYKNDALWFRLLVMHTYHAGIGNVRAALYSMSEYPKDMQLIYKLWNTSARGFQSASQNYSQIILAAHLEFDKL